MYPFRTCCSRKRTQRGDPKVWPMRKKIDQTVFIYYLKHPYHVECLKHLSLVTCTITIESKCCGVLAKILLCECDTCSYRNLCTDDTIATEERGSEDVHRAALAVRHAGLATKQLSNNTLD